MATAYRSEFPVEGAFRALLFTQPDSRLAPLIRAGSGPAFDELVRRYRPKLVRLARSVGADQYSAEDIVQESLLRAKVAIENGLEPKMLSSWLKTIVRNGTLNWIRDTKEESELDDRYAGSGDVSQSVEERMRVRSAIDAIKDLPDQQRAAIVGHEVQGLSHAELGKSLGTSTGAVRQLIFRARKTLRSRDLGLVVPLPILVGLARKTGLVAGVGATSSSSSGASGAVGSGAAAAGGGAAVAGEGAAAAGGAGLVGVIASASKLAATTAAVAGAVVIAGSAAPPPTEPASAKADRPLRASPGVDREVKVAAVTPAKPAAVQAKPVARQASAAKKAPSGGQATLTTDDGKPAQQSSGAESSPGPRATPPPPPPPPKPAPKPQTSAPQGGGDWDDDEDDDDWDDDDGDDDDWDDDDDDDGDDDEDDD